MEGNPIQLDYTILLTVMLPIFVVYLVIHVLRHFKRKEATDEALLQKLDELIKLQTQQSDKGS